MKNGTRAFFLLLFLSFSDFSLVFQSSIGTVCGVEGIPPLFITSKWKSILSHRHPIAVTTEHPDKHATAA